MTQCDPLGLIHRTVSETFRVEEFVAEGGYGVVYRGFHELFRAPIALKVLKIPAGLTEEGRAHFWEEFRREAEVQFRLSSITKYIVRPFHIGKVDVGRGHPLPIMALEWLEGVNLGVETKLRAASGMAPRNLPELLDLLGGAARAIHLSHTLERQGGRYSVVHRDIKPENLFLARVGDEEVVKVLDFGTSKVGHMMGLLAGDPTLTGRPSQFSPAYGAPEQWVPSSLGQTGPWTDVWGMALTLVELMKGAHVFSGNVHKAMFMCLDGTKRPTPRNHGLEVNDAVESVFERALAVDPRQRIQSMRDLWKDLRTAVHVEMDEAPVSFGARETADGEVPPLADSSELPFILTEPDPSREPRRRPPQTGTFPIADALADEAHTLASTGTDAERADTIRDLAPDWND